MLLLFLLFLGLDIGDLVVNLFDTRVLCDVDSKFLVAGPGLCLVI